MLASKVINKVSEFIQNRVIMLSHNKFITKSRWNHRKVQYQKIKISKNNWIQLQVNKYLLNLKVRKNNLKFSNTNQGIMSFLILNMLAGMIINYFKILKISKILKENKECFNIQEMSIHQLLKESLAIKNLEDGQILVEAILLVRIKRNQFILKYWIKKPFTRAK